MKATRQEPGFVPVTLTLESQHEVDAVFALLNHSDLSKAVNLTEAHRSLSPFAVNYRPLHTAICAKLETEYGPKTERVCSTCLHSRKSVDHEPCKGCMSASAWKPKGTRTV